MNKYIVSVKLILNSNVVNGFINRNKHGKYYPSAAHSMIFDNLLTALLAIDQLKESYGVIETEIKDLVDNSIINVTSDLIHDEESLGKILKSIIEFRLRPRFDLDYIDFSFSKNKSGSYTISWYQNDLHIINDKICFVPSQVETTILKSGPLITYNDELISDIVTVFNLYATNSSLDSYLEKYNINIGQ